MPEGEIDTLVRECLSLVLGRPVDADTPLDRRHDADWDSLRHVELIFMLEDRTGMRFTEAESTGLQSVDDIVALIRSRHEA